MEKNARLLPSAMTVTFSWSRSTEYPLVNKMVNAVEPIKAGQEIGQNAATFSKPAFAFERFWRTCETTSWTIHRTF